MLRDYQIKRMFQEIAVTYDFQNSFLSLGRDIYWRRALADSVQAGDGALLLDMATGTAEIAIEICRRKPGIRVVGVDFSSKMLAIGRKKLRSGRLADRVYLSIGDGRSLPFKSAFCDAITIAFGIRNIEERHLVLAEFRRVLRPGGQLLIMEFDYPDHPVMGRVYRLYFERLLPAVGNWLSRTHYAYTHLVDSVARFPREEAFIKEIAAAGFTDVRVTKLTYGIAKIYTGVSKMSSSLAIGVSAAAAGRADSSVPRLSTDKIGDMMPMEGDRRGRS